MKIKFDALDESAKLRHRQTIPGTVQRDFARKCMDTRVDPVNYLRNLKQEADDEHYFIALK